MVHPLLLNISVESPLISHLQDDLGNESIQEQGIMELDPSHEQIRGPLTPGSPGMDTSDELRMSVDGEDNKVKFSPAVVGLKELTPHEPEADHVEHDKVISADDHEAMKASVLDSPGDLEILEEKYSTWEIRNYSKLQQRNHSPEFECGGFKWQILFFPWGNNQKENSSAYLEVVPPENAPQDWYVCAQFAIVMYNPTNPTKQKAMAAQHRFYAGETDWGFTQFLSVRAAYLRSAHSNETQIAKGGNDTNITAYVRIVKDPSGVLWHNYRDYDSRRQTGYVGLRNQGATCYMNSLLQSLYFTNFFRKIVFKIPTEGADPVKSLSLALQRVFVQLQTSPDPVSTTGLTQSFGWDSYESFVQHDAQEFERVLLEGLENGMKEASKIKVITDVPLTSTSPPPEPMEVDVGATKLGEGTLQDQLKRLFCGKMESYIKCVNVDYESRRGEEFWDLQLNVKGTKDLRASFEDLVAVEMMDGDNQYRAEGHGLQDAKKGVAFLTFPPVLHLQLKRFEYDFNRDAIVKINDRYEFPLEIDLSDFLAASADRSVSYNYKLHGVLVHSGDVHGGHYFGMIKPEKDSKWYRYDDERVIPVTIDDVLEENFGGEGTSLFSQQNGFLPQSRMARNAAQWKRFTSAYMLVYFREDAIDEILSPITPQDVPNHVIKTVEEERIEAERLKREKEEMHLYMTVRVIDVETFRHHDGVDLTSFDPADKEAQEWIHSYRVRRDLTWLGFYQHIAEANHLRRDEIRLWHLVNRQNRTIRPDTPVPPDSQMTIEGWLKASTSKGELRLYMERAEEIWHPTVAVLPKRPLPPPPPPLPHPPTYTEEPKDLHSTASSGHSSRSLSNGDIEIETTNGTQGEVEWPDVGKMGGLYNSRHDAAMIMIFLKWFDVDNQCIRGQRAIYVNRHDKTGRLTSIVADMMNWKAEQGEPPVSIVFYEEIKPGMIEPLKPNATFVLSEIQDGDIICFMRGQSTKRLDELIKEGKYPDPARYYEFLHNKITLRFMPRYSDQIVKEDFQCVLAKTMKYEQVASKVAEHLKVQPTHLRFTATTGDGRPRPLPIKRTGPLPTITQLTMSGGLPLPPVVFYEVLELSLADMESRREINITWLPDGLATMESVSLLVSRQATVEEVIQALVKKLPSIPAEVYDRIRLFDVRGHREYREFQLTQALSTTSIDTSYGTSFFAEPVPTEEDEAGEHDKFIIIVHFAKDIARLHGVPLKFVMKPRELWYDTKKRLQKRLGYKDKEFAKIKLYFVPDAYYHSKISPLEDEDIVYDRLSEKLGREFIGLDHPDRSPGRKLGFGEKALSIKS